MKALIIIATLFTLAQANAAVVIVDETFDAQTYSIETQTSVTAENAQLASAMIEPGSSET